MNRPRRVLMRFVVIPVICVVGLILAAGWFGRDNVFRYLIQPQTPFQVEVPPTVPDYTTPSAWAARPLDEAATGPAVFFIHGNTSWSTKSWNVAYDDGPASLMLQRYGLPNHAGPFTKAGAIWAPRYRQATLFSLLAGRPDTRDALDVAYSDVARAFAAFVAARPADAPWILVGTGQGGHHGARLLAEQVVGKPAGQSLVAAYILEQAIGTSMVSTGGVLAGLPPCTAPEQATCLVSYQTVDQGDARAAQYARERGLRVHRGVGTVSEADVPVCINPLLGMVGTAAPPSANRGAASASGLEPGVRPAMSSGETGATCVDGLLLVDPVRPPSLRPDPWDIGSLHKPAPYNLFWQALEDDSVRRLAAFERGKTGR